MRAKRPGANENRGETTQGANGIRGETTRYQHLPMGAVQAQIYCGLH
jgi:hypothetical protein